MDWDEKRKILIQTIRFLDKSTKVYFYLYDLVNKRVYFTDKICEKYLLPSAGEQGISVDIWKSIIYPRDWKMLEENSRKVKDGLTDSYNREYRLIDRNGNKVWINCRGTVQKDEYGRPEFMIGNISELVEGYRVDNLTGLWNSDKFMEDMEKYLREGVGYLMVLDVDNFKNINVKNGRIFGNYILKKISDILEDHADYSLEMYRLDGDRFAVNFPGKSQENVISFYNSIKKDLETHCTISAGVVSYHSSDSVDSGRVYQYAESALDRAKREGKNTLIFFSAKDFQKSLDRIRFQDEIRESVQQNCKGFFLCYQPQIASKDFRLYGAEVLLRYKSSTRGVVGPADFIPFLEQSGIIAQVGIWVLRMAASQCVQWRKTIPDFHINVNISYVQLRQDDIVETVLDILQETGLPGEALTLEVTESMQLQDYSYFNKIFYEWKRYGIKIAIDDFGTGYSSLSYLKSIDVDETKIDRCFINRVHYNDYNYRLLRNMIELAHSVQIQVCCEGVETEEELKILQQLKPDIFQGFLFARPCEKEKFEKLYIDKEDVEYKKRLQREQNWCQIDSTEDNWRQENFYKEELDNIVESMDEIICVSDVESYNLYYLNPAGQKMTGVYDYKGCKCHQVLFGRNASCEPCVNSKLREDEFSIWELKNSIPGKRFIVKEKLISWQGKIARLTIVSDITQNEKENTLAHRASRLNSQLPCYYEEILNTMKLGLWVIRIDTKTGKAEMYTNEVMDHIMGLESSLSPEQCYSYWYNRINEGYYQYVNRAVDNIIQSGKLVQVEYTWKHPVKGEVTVRCMGIRVADSDGKICLEGYHRSISDLDRPYFLPGRQKSEIFEYNEKKHAIYFHTGRNTISGEKKREKDFPECWIRDQIVHPHFVETFREMFSNVQSKENTHAREMLLCTKNGAYEWFKLKTRHLGQREKDINTIVVLMESAGHERAMELEYMRKSVFYEAMLSETVAYAEVDVESGRLTTSGGFWAHYVDQNRIENFNDVIERYVDSVVYPEDNLEYRKYLNMNHMKEMYKKGVKNQKYSFRRYVDGQLCWMELVIHVFQDRYTENMYALLYLKDIDAVKKRELAQKHAAQRDPLTNVYNRSIFEHEVVGFIKKEYEKTPKGALIIFDLDNFKQINDEFGHLKGDDTLKIFTEILKGTFRSQDLIGRLGGDEFLVFVKNVSDREIMDKRMKGFFEKLENIKEISLTCSAGVCFIKDKDFNYRAELGKADIALYNSKKKGKNQYSYYEE